MEDGARVFRNLFGQLHHLEELTLACPWQLVLLPTHLGVIGKRLRKLDLESYGGYRHPMSFLFLQQIQIS
jgi:hypothetical protein